MTSGHNEINVCLSHFLASSRTLTKLADGFGPESSPTLFRDSPHVTIVTVGSPASWIQELSDYECYAILFGYTWKMNLILRPL